MNPRRTSFPFAWFLAAACALATAPALRAQKLALAGGNQQVAVFDVGAFVGAAAADATPPAFPGRAAAAESSGLQRLAAALRAFAAAGACGGEQPDDLVPLGRRHLVALGSATEIAAVERFLAQATAAADLQLQLDVRICRVPAAVFAARLADKLAAPQPAAAGPAAAGPHVGVLAPEDGRQLFQSLVGEQVDVLQAPVVVVQNLHTASLAVGEQIAFLRDFEIETVDQARIASPVLDEVWHGQQIEAVCAALDGDRIAVQLQALDQRVERPLREVKTKVAGVPGGEVTVQLPQVSGTRASQTAVVANGGTAVVAARRGDGDWLVVTTTVHRLRPGDLPQSRR